MSGGAQRCGVLAGGNWIIDHVKLIETWPPQDALVTILSETAGNGGSPYNLLKDLARLEAPFPLAGVGLVGDDEDGRTILADCAAHGIDARQIRATREAATSYTDVMTVQGTGRRTFFHQRGANALLEPGHFDFAATPAKIFHLGYLLLLDRLDALDAAGRPYAGQVLAAARKAGLKTSIDVVSEHSERFQQVVGPVLGQVDYCFVNDYEAERLTGLGLRRAGALEKSAVEQAAGQLLATGVQEWVFIHAPEAVYARSVTGESRWQASVRLDPAEIQGAAGAGDALAAGVLLGLHESWPLAECLQLGVCAAAASLFLPGCSAAVRPASACLALATTHGFLPLPGEME